MSVLLAQAHAVAQSQLNVRWYDTVGILALDADAARATASRTFRRAGLDVGWRICAGGDGGTGENPCARPLAHDEIIVRIIDTPPRATVPGNTLGYAHTNGEGTGGVLATVLADRVITIARTAGVAVGPLLGRVIVHEIGHLGGLKHTPTGLMRDHWTVDQLRDPREQWVLWPAQAAQMRGLLARSELAAR